MKKIGIIVIAVLLLGGYFLFEGTDILTPKPQAQPPRVLKKRDVHERVTIEEPSEPTTESGILDFNEVHRFSSIEEIGKIRFIMTVGKVYRMGDHNEYSYHGIKTQYSHTGGAVHVTDTSDPEYTIVHRYLFMVGQGFSIWFLPVGEGRSYSVRVIEVNPTTLKLRIEDITD